MTSLLGPGDLSADFSHRTSHSSSGDPCMQAVPNGKQFTAWLLKEQNICSTRNPLDELERPRGHSEVLSGAARRRRAAMNPRPRSSKKYGCEGVQRIQLPKSVLLYSISATEQLPTGLVQLLLLIVRRQLTPLISRDKTTTV